MAKNYSFEVQRKVDEDRSLIRLVTSWATKESAVEEFIAELSRLM